MSGSVVVPELLSTIKRVRLRSTDCSMCTTVAGSVLSSTHSRGYTPILPNVRRKTSAQRLLPPIPRSTDPATVVHIEQSVDLTRTLFIVASKSGTTTEPLMFYRYFFARVSQVKPDRPGAHFIAITDPGTPRGESA